MLIGIDVMLWILLKIRTLRRIRIVRLVLLLIRRIIDKDFKENKVLLSVVF